MTVSATINVHGDSNPRSGLTFSGLSRCYSSSAKKNCDDHLHSFQSAVLIHDIHVLPHVYACVCVCVCVCVCARIPQRRVIPSISCRRRKVCQFAGNKTTRGLCLKFDRKACMYCLAGQNGHFQSQIVVSQPPSLLFVPPNDPSMLCDRFMGAVGTHSSTRFVTGE